MAHVGDSRGMRHADCDNPAKTQEKSASAKPDSGHPRITTNQLTHTRAEQLRCAELTATCDFRALLNDTHSDDLCSRKFLLMRFGPAGHGNSRHNLSKERRCGSGQAFAGQDVRREAPPLRISTPLGVRQKCRALLSFWGGGPKVSNDRKGVRWAARKRLLASRRDPAWITRRSLGSAIDANGVAPWSAARARATVGMRRAGAQIRGINVWDAVVKPAMCTRGLWPEERNIERPLALWERSMPTPPDVLTHRCLDQLWGNWRKDAGYPRTRSHPSIHLCIAMRRKGHASWAQLWWDDRRHAPNQCCTLFRDGRQIKDAMRPAQTVPGVAL